MVLVEHHDAMIEDGTAHDFVLLARLDGLDLIGRDVGDEVVLTRDQAVDAPGNLGNHNEANLAHARLAAPVVVVGCEDEDVVGLELLDLERSGRDRRRREGLPVGSCEKRLL